MPPIEPLSPFGNPATASVSRRRLILGVGTAVVLGGCSGDDPATDSASPDAGDHAASSTTTGPSATSTPDPTPSPRATTAPGACVLTPELTAGPYHLDGHLARTDITEDREGTPLGFTVRVLALPGCEPLEGAAVDIWHCDAGGEYSGFNGNSLEATQAGGTNDRRFLRGVQLTDADGRATFDTIFPGWYEGRTVHIHLKVLEGGTLDRTYDGGHVAHVGQAFFDEATTAEILASGAYLAHTGNRTTNEQDSIYAQAGPGAITAVTARPGDDPGAGVIGEFTCMVDPDATPPPAPLF